MASFGNQATHVAKTKKERLAANQFSDGAVPVVPISEGKNWYSEINLQIEKDYSIPINRMDSMYYAIYISGAILDQIHRNGTIFSQGIEAIGIWFNRDRPIGKIEIEAYWLTAHAPPPPGNPLFDAVDLTSVQPIPIHIDDIDSKEEVIVHLPVQPYVNIDPTGLLFIIRPGPGYSNPDPVFLGTQDGIGAQIQLVETDIDLTTMTVGRWDALLVANNFNILPKTPMCRVYPKIQRGMTILDAEGNAIKAGAPFNMRAWEEINLQGVSSFAEGELNWDQFFGDSGLPMAGRLREVQFQIAGGTSSVPEYTRYLLKISAHLFDDPGQVYEIWTGNLQIPVTALKPTAALNYLMLSDRLMTQGLRAGMFVIKNPGPGQVIGYIYKVEEDIDYVGAILRPVTRAYVIDIQTELPMSFIVADTVVFTCLPQTGIAHPPSPALQWLSLFKWEMNIPYQTTTDPPGPSGYPPFRYVLRYKIWAMDGDVTQDITTHLVVYVEEDNRLTQTNPSRSIAGAESIQRAW